MQPLRRVRGRFRDLPCAGRRQDQLRKEQPYCSGHRVCALARRRVVHHARPRAVCAIFNINPSINESTEMPQSIFRSC
nr:MAG TPA: hypothetical protein [Caudoviricetes sp.]